MSIETDGSDDSFSGQGLMSLAPNDSETFPASFSQYRIWFIEQMSPETEEGFHQSLVISLKGSLEPDAVQGALLTIVDRHESLRTILFEQDGRLVQAACDRRPLDISLLDLTHCDDEERQSEIDRLTNQSFRQPFDLAHGPLLRATLVRMSEDHQLLLLTLHQTASDRHSLGILCREFFGLLYPEGSDLSVSVPKLDWQYKDHSIGQHDRFRGENLEKALSFWRPHLAGLEPELRLPYDRVRLATMDLASDRHELVLSAELTRSIRSLCETKKISPLVGYLAAFQILLYRYTGLDDLVIGLLVPNRTLQTEQLIGSFEDTLVLRSDFSDEPTFAVLLDHVRQTIETAREHELPFEKLVEELRPKRDLAIHPLIQVMFSLRKTLPDLHRDGLSLDAREIAPGTSMMDLSLILEEGTKEVRGWLEYNRDLFDPETIARMANHYAALLARITKNPDCPVSRLSLLTDEERHQILVDWNQTRGDFPSEKCIHQLFEEQVGRTPNAVAVFEAGRQLTYDQLNRKANQLAWKLIDLGIVAETMVGICADRSIDYVAGSLAILKAGGCFVPLDPAYPQDRLEVMLEDCGAPVVLVPERFASVVPQTQARIHQYSVIGQQSSESASQSPNLRQENPERPCDPSQLAYVIYTSGSTGKPKGVLLEHRGVVNLVSWYHQTKKPTPEDRLTQIARPGFDASIGEIWPCLTSGAALYIPDSQISTSPADLLSWLTEHRITISDMPTPIAEAVLHQPWPAECSLRAIITGGDKLRQRPPQSVPCPLFDQYGPTENTVTCTEARVEPEGSDSPMHIGRPIMNHQAYILDRNLQPVPIGVTGELHFGGVGLARGYLNRPDSTDEKFIPDPFDSDPSARLYKTGDLARFLRDGSIQYLGRIDFQTKIRGFRIELGEIESVLRQHPAVGDAIVLARSKEPDDDKYLVGYVIAKEKESPPSAASLRDHLAATLPPYMVPPHFVILDEFPLTPNGKIDRRAFPDRDRDQKDPGVVYVGPRNDTEHDLAAVWQEVLKLDRPIGISENFFDLGGHSLLAAVLMAKIRNDLGHTFPLGILFEAPTVEKMAVVLEEQLELGSKGNIVTFNDEGSRPPLFLLAGVGGHVFTFYKFSRLLGPDQPTYGVKAIGVDGSELSPDRIEDIAAIYIDEITTLRPEGPVLLAGYSIGALIALEIALQLRSRGRQVGFVCIFDMLAPGYPKPLPVHRRMLIHLKNFVRMKGQERSEYLKERLENLKGKVMLKLGLGMYNVPEIPVSEGLPQENFERVHVALTKAHDAYWPMKGFDGKILLFKAEETFDWPAAVFDDPLLGWKEWTTGQVEEHIVPGGHMDVFSDANLDQLAEMLGECIQKQKMN